MHGPLNVKNKAVSMTNYPRIYELHNLLSHFPPTQTEHFFFITFTSSSMRCSVCEESRYPLLQKLFQHTAHRARTSILLTAE